MIRPLQLITAPDGSLSASKVGTLVFGLTFTAKMVRDMPDDPWMWLCFGALIGGIDIAKKFLNMRYGQPQMAPVGEGERP